MALPTVADCKSYLRKEDTSEDALLAQLLARALAMIETYLGYPITAASRTYTDYAERYSGFIQLPGPFLITGTPPVVTDVNGGTVDASSYTLDQRSGKIRWAYGRMPTAVIPAQPYTVVATIGLSEHPDYAGSLEAVASNAIVDLVAHLYQNRNPAVLSQADEGGGSVSLTPDGIPARILQDLSLLPCTSQMVFA
jgi:uncharacterized phiE125 gp8 family phage protein